MNKDLHGRSCFVWIFLCCCFCLDTWRNILINNKHLLWHESSFCSPGEVKNCGGTAAWGKSWHLLFIWFSLMRNSLLSPQQICWCWDGWHDRAESEGGDPSGRLGWAARPVADNLGEPGFTAWAASSSNIERLIVWVTSEGGVWTCCSRLTSQLWAFMESSTSRVCTLLHVLVIFKSVNYFAKIRVNLLESQLINMH